ncbi:MAG TPA: hypothetical protein VGK73_08330 [Polyangiaceae bacterium]
MPGRCAGALLAALAAGACSPSLPPPAAEVGKPAQEMPPSFKCEATQGQTRPLIVEWSAPDRASLEALAKHNQIVVHFEGCSLLPLRQCRAPQQSYGYTAITPKDEVVSMKNADELYANVPVHAVQLEGKLRQTGELRAAMRIVGMYEARGVVPALDQLQGDCSSATHVVTALTVGAFEFSAGKVDEGSAQAGIFGVGAGASRSNQKETLSRDGDVAACNASAGGDSGPPDRCGALLRLEVATLRPAGANTPKCGDGTKLVGFECKPVEKPSELAPEDRDFVDDRNGFQWGDRCYKHFKAGALGYARAACTKGLEASPDAKVRAAITYNLGLVEEASGDKKAGCEWLRQSLAARPGVGAVQGKFDALDCKSVLATPR